MNHTRRAFVQSSLVAMSLPFSAHLRAARSRDARLLTVTDAASEYAQRFTRRCAIDFEAFDGDPASCMAAFEDALVPAEVKVLFGLTTDSNRFIAEQIAAPHGYRREYSGIHDFRERPAVHILEGHGRFVDALGDAFDANPDGWIEAAAATLPRLALPHPGERRRTVDASRAATGRTPAYLVSWSLRRT